MNISHRFLAAVCVCLCINSVQAQGPAPVRATSLVSVGDALSGSTIASLNPVFTNGEGRPGALLALANNARVIWYDGAVAFDSSTVTSNVLVGGESSIGIGDQGRFVYSPSIDGNDGLWSQIGRVASEPDPIQGQPGLFWSFTSRPNMLPDGRALWIGGFANTAGGATQGRLFARANTVGTPGVEILLRSGDVVAGFPIGSTGIGFNYAMSDNGNQYATVLIIDTGSTATDSLVYVTGSVVAQEGSPIPGVAGENWQGFAGVAVNNSGNWLLAGDTSGDAGTDAFLAYNGTLAVREGDTLDGQMLTTPAALRAVSINNRGRAAHIWNTASNVRKVFIADDATQLAASRFLIGTGSTLDLDADGVGDGTVVDVLGTFTATTAVSLGDDSTTYLHVSYSTPGGTRESLLRFDAEGVFSDGFEPTAVAGGD